MASTELDPLFLKGLKLLHSKSKDSAEQLKQLLDEALMQSKQAAVTSSKDKNFTSIKVENENRLHLKKVSSREISDIGSMKQMQEDTRKREIEKRHQDKISCYAEDVEVVHESKIPKLDSPQSISYYPSSPDIPKLDHFVSKRMDDDSDSSDDVADADDFAMEMGLACVICKQLDVTHGNQLIECQECHSLYHQECHTPPATDYDVNDPRRVWYCAKCTKNMKKMASKTQKVTKTSTSTISVPSQARFSKPESSQPAVVLPFKRSELKAPVSQGSNQTSTNKPIGLAGLAANFSGRVTTPASSSSSSLSSASRPGSTKASSSASLKPFSSLSSHSATPSLKPIASASSLKIINTSSHGFSSLSSTSSSSSTIVPPIVIAKNSSSSSSSAPKTGLGLLSSAVAAAAASGSSSSRAANASSSNNGGTKPATCSLFMSADKRVQIMKKKAAKLQEKRRLSTK